MRNFVFILSLCSALCTACSGNVSSLHTAAPPAASSTTRTAGAVDWPVWGFDPARSNFNSAEHTLTVANVHRLHVRWQIAFGNGLFADSSPILVSHVLIGASYHPMLFETTKSGVTFGIEATTGHIVWTFPTSGGRSTFSAPAADPSDTAIYAPGIDGKVHKLNASNGQEIDAPGFPVLVSLMPHTELDESALNVANGYLYVTLGGSGTDDPPYHGHVVSVRLSDGKTMLFNTLCSQIRSLLGPSSCPQQRAGIWSRGGAVVDPDPSTNGRVYVASGNGDFNANRSGYNYGDTVLALSADLSDLLGHYTPADYNRLQDEDLDLGSSSPALLPWQPTSRTPWMLVQGGKDAVLRLVNRAPLPGVGGELQLIDLPTRVFSTPAVWTDASNRAWVFVGLVGQLHAYRLETNRSGVSRLASIWRRSAATTKRGTSPVVANGIVFVAFDRAVIAFNAVTGAELWSSAQPSAGKTIGTVHFQSPIVVNGWVYCSDQNGFLTAYGLH
jgi:outer membrane protein assembly factor BamB